MIVGIGNDIIEIERVEKAISKEGFIAKVYTQREIENIVTTHDELYKENIFIETKNPASKEVMKSRQWQK